ncbi:hypothetical protein, partial [Bacillus cereus]|uniref:hypothetical protein n=1 Tax=Bacillus cereus TaxID=1396 RepID=UPI000A9AA689
KKKKFIYFVNICTYCPYTARAAVVFYSNWQSSIPLELEHITLTDDYVWNLDQKTNFDNLRPLRGKTL